MNETVALAAVATALVNIASGAALIRWATGRRFLWLHGLGLAFRAATLFGAAHALYQRGASAAQLVFFIFAVAIAQMIGQIYYLEKSRTRKDKE